jgi:heme/copper-type cytochrome/quinol oxidase subunit 3
VSLITKTLIAVLLSATAGMVAMITPLTSVVGAWAFFLVAVPVFAAVFAAYALQKTKEKQTSFQQPVRIVELTHQGYGNVAALTLSFTHARYAQAFANANKDEVARGVLVVQEAREPLGGKRA